MYPDEITYSTGGRVSLYIYIYYLNNKYGTTFVIIYLNMCELMSLINYYINNQMARYPNQNNSADKKSLSPASTRYRYIYIYIYIYINNNHVVYHGILYIHIYIYIYIYIY